MPVSVALVKATPQRLVLALTGDGSSSVSRIGNATLQGYCAAGALQNTLNATYVTDGTSVQSAMRRVLGGGNVELRVNNRDNPVAWAVDVEPDLDAPSKPAIKLRAAAALGAGEVAFLVIESKHSLVQ